MEKLTLRRSLAAAGIAILGGLTLAGCTDNSFSDGTGSEFIVRGPLDDAVANQVEIHSDQIQVLDASGLAAYWLGDPFNAGGEFDYVFYNQYTMPVETASQTCGNDVVVGRVVDVDGTEIPLDELNAGDYVEVRGQVRDSNLPALDTDCAVGQRAVFETVTVLEHR